jgi:hypothetical protein
MDDKSKTKAQLIAELRELRQRPDRLVGHRDVTDAAEESIERARSEDALLTGDERFLALFRGSPVPMLLFQWQNDDLMLIDCNASADLASQGRIARMVGSAAKHVFRDEPEFLGRLYECYDGGAPSHLEYRHQLWDTDTLVYVSVFAAFVPPDLLVIQAQDVTKFRELEAELLNANESLREERKALVEKNIALRVISDQIKDEVNQVKQNLQSNIDMVVMPVLRRMGARSRGSDRADLNLLESLLSDVTSPFVRVTESEFVNLSPREVEICYMIANGMLSKDIGRTLGISVRTVEKIRQQVRRKLNIAGSSGNLSTLIRSFMQRHQMPIPASSSKSRPRRPRRRS